ncbi:MAG: class I SAM-dependent methyltransferase [Rhodobacteraceae bacterium]|nr:class I SAM-dependent methyltransferase [Paracoccaceae bacterium]
MIRTAMFKNTLHNFFQRVVKKGALDVIYASGTKCSYGDGTGSHLEIVFKDRGAERGCVLNPMLRVGELYMDRRFVIAKGTLYDVAQLMMNNRMRDHILPTAKWLMAPHFLFDRVKNFWRAKSESSQIAHHYNIDNRLYQLFLDDDWHYSAGHFEREGMTLEEAQLVKKRYLTAKLAVEADHKVLDIGCGWGGLDFYIAELTGAHVTGISLSEEQLKIARQRAINRGLADSTEFLHQNYRDVAGTYDRVISVEMLEHIGKHNYDIYFQKAFDVLDKFGVFVVQSTVRPAQR